MIIWGLGSIIGIFAYLKTKNMLVSYAVHVIYDLLALGLAGLGLESGGIPMLTLRTSDPR